MSIVAEIRVAPGDFELGRLFAANMEPGDVVELETVVPADDDAVPYFHVSTADPDRFLSAISDARAVDHARTVEEFDEQRLVAFDWDVDRDSLFGAVFRSGVALMRARGWEDRWILELRFDDRSSLEAFREHCDAVGIDLTVERLYSPGSPTDDLSFGVTEPQREALTLAIERGYYDVPRAYTTADLAEELGISDQAVSERLRRGIAALVEHTLGTDSGDHA